MEERFFGVLGRRVRALQVGAGSRGDPLVLVHGVGGWAENWSEVLGPLAATGRRVVAIDLPGFGASERPRHARYFDPERPYYARFMVEALDVLGIERAHLIGNSLGGAVAYVAATTFPERARSLVLVAPGGLGAEVPLFMRLATLPGAGLLARLPRRPESADAVLRSCFYDPAAIPAHLYDEVRTYGQRSLGEFIRVLRYGVDVRGVKPRLRARWAARSVAYRGPVLVLWGREDLVLPVRQAAAAEALFPAAEVRIIERCGHLPQVEQPQAFVDALAPFLDRAEGASRAARTL